ncbi:hypothetical protein SpiGrapes_2455 [Sphaerochaeta pleomorpha str. Grapes]|uniref:Uncharacterized protein n=1 Tax=Sphaerochaeta pleomorpha (strain ATCC BAA-1885 / DSM 22778 / Grapes) TaxID=158190 RepID=G8QTH7_SPHPG|nr:hypothetical protein SpiGrapes_2455 [Sphaerochaeta pleomorpha str. Grapes]
MAQSSGTDEIGGLSSPVGLDKKSLLQIIFSFEVAFVEKQGFQLSISSV